MPTLAERFAAGRKPNRARTAAGRTIELINATPADKFGFGALAKIPLKLHLGEQDREAADIDEQNAAAFQELVNKEAKTEEEKVAFKRKFDIMSKAFTFHNAGDTGSAVALMNSFKKDLGLSENYDVSSILGEGTEGPGKGAKIELRKKDAGSTTIIGISPEGVNKWNAKTQKWAPATQAELNEISDKKTTKQVSTKERILAKIEKHGYDLLSPSEKEAWDFLDDTEKTIAQEVLKTLRVSEEFKALNDDNDPGSKKRDAMIKGMTETVRSLFNPPDQQDIEVGGEFGALGDAGNVDVVRGVYPDRPPGQDFETAGAAGGSPAGVPIPDAPDLSQAQRAPDGLLYIPDPDRPGKYLRVEE